MSALVQLRDAVDERDRTQARGERVRHTAPASAGRSMFRSRTAADVMTRFPPTVHQDASLWTAWDRLHGVQSNHLVVVDDDRRPIGVLDVQTVALEWPPGPLGPHRIPVHSLLRRTARPVVRSGDDLAEVARTMLAARADAVPVVDREGRLYGLITLWHYAQLAVPGDAAAIIRG